MGKESSIINETLKNPVIKIPLLTIAGAVIGSLFGSVGTLVGALGAPLYEMTKKK